MDFALAIHMVHEVEHRGAFFMEVWKCLQPAATLILIEPRFHVSPKDFRATVALSLEAGFRTEPLGQKLRGRSALLVKG